jgi:hypothetical protein
MQTSINRCPECYAYIDVRCLRRVPKIDAIKIEAKGRAHRATTKRIDMPVVAPIE